MATQAATLDFVTTEISTGPAIFSTGPTKIPLASGPGPAANVADWPTQIMAATWSVPYNMRVSQHSLDRGPVHPNHEWLASSAWV